MPVNPSRRKSLSLHVEELERRTLLATRAYLPSCNQISVFDGDTRVEIGTIPTSICQPSDHIAVTPNGNEAYVVGYNSSNLVSVVDLVGGREIATIPTGVGTVWVAASPRGDQVYVTLHDQSSDNLIVLSTATHEVVATLSVGNGPHDIRFSPDGSRAYVMNTGGGPVSVIDTATLQVVTTISVGSGIHGIAISPDGSRLYVDTVAPAVYVIDLATNSVHGSIPLPFQHNGGSIALTPDGRKLYVVAVTGQNDMAVIDTATSVAKLFPMSGPLGDPWISPDGGFVWVRAGGSVAFIDTMRDIVVGTSPVSGGFGPGIAFGPVPAPQTPDIEMLSATTEDSQSVTFQYAVTGSDIQQSFNVGIYRSADQTCDTGDTLLKTQEIVPPDGSVGIHLMQVSATLPIDPSHPYVCAIADTAQSVDETDETNNTAFFRKIVIGVVTQGFAIDGRFPDNLWDVKLNLIPKAGYRDAIICNWANESRLPINGITTTQARLCAQQVVGEVKGITQSDPDVVVDLHFIGHSRGAVVMSQAIQFLEDPEALGAPVPSQIQRGYVKMTMLDPHPANDRQPPLYSMGFFGRRSAKHAAKACLNLAARFDPSNRDSCVGLGALFNQAKDDPAFLSTKQKVKDLLDWFQSRADDPEVTMPRIVDESEVYYQQTRSLDLFLANPIRNNLIETYFFNLWGEVPPALAATASQCNLTTGVLDQAQVGHSEVVDWYLENVVPKLRSETPFRCV